MTLAYCCPRCKGPVEATGDAYRCEPCDATYPVVLGIPDFRVYPDPYISIEDDHAKARKIADAGTSTEMMERYWSITPDTPDDMAQRFVAHSLEGEERGRHLIEQSQHQSRSQTQPQTGAAGGEGGGTALELGCRTGGVTVALAERFGHAVGIDIAFRWLVVARKRLEEAGHAGAQIVCCCADALPFRDAGFDLVLAENVLEHTKKQQELVDEAYRALAPGGTLYAKTWNRVSPAPEPHTKLLFVGWMPRGLARRYVKWRGRDTYDHVRLISWLGLRRLVKRSPFRRGRIRPHRFSDARVARLGAAGRLVVRAYMAMCRWPVFRQLCQLLGPELEATLVRDP